ncbi:MAG TPA: NAD(P)/FAD-dependent oxidoreductase, partial [Candidatus Avipropionibacterium avicola]|nr:NAD(P)/FAD-dependent oxidoreductase [Candidatus Avipropionibacterium avicola]
LDTAAGALHAQRVINATGSWGRPFVPTWAGLDRFVGRQLHTAQYRGPEEFVDQRVAVIGGGNSAAQILAEIAPVAAATRWITRRAPRFMPADVDGEVLFELAGARRQAGGARACGERLGDIVVTAAVERARRERHLVAHQPFTRFDGADLVWNGPGERWRADAVLWCTGFRDDLRHLSGSGLRGAGARVPVQDGVSTIDPRFGFVGHGDWTGPFSNTIIGVGGYARVTTGLMGVEQMGAGRRDL